VPLTWDGKYSADTSIEVKLRGKQLRYGSSPFKRKRREESKYGFVCEERKRKRECRKIAGNYWGGLDRPRVGRGKKEDIFANHLKKGNSGLILLPLEKEPVREQERGRGGGGKGRGGTFSTWGFWRARSIQRRGRDNSLQFLGER